MDDGSSLPRARFGALVKAVAKGTSEFKELTDALMPLLNAGREIPPDVALELSTALIDLESETVTDDQLFALVNAHGPATLALARSGQILAVNAAAAEFFRLATGDGLGALSITRAEFDAFTRRLSEGPGATIVKARGVDEKGLKVPVLMAGMYSPAYRAFVLRALQQHWPDSVDRALRELFGLSQSEREVLSGLARGLHSEQIAGERNRSVGTVRQQVKSILHKLDVGTQLEAATMAAAAAATTAGTVETGRLTVGPLPRGGREQPMELDSFTREGRVVGVRRFGDRSGEPVILVHGPSFGAGEYPEDRRLAEHYRLDVHAVERPGYGRTQAVDASDSVIEAQVDDIVAYLDRSGLDRFGILAHEVGLIPALALARRCPDRVRCVLAVSAAPPFRNLDQLHAMPGHQAIFIQSARYAPWLARLMTRLLTIRTRRLGVERWTDVIFEGLEPDSRVMRRPGMRSGIIGTYSFYLNQMGSGFEFDLRMMLEEWEPLIADLEIPTVLLHGGRNPTTPPAYAQVFRAINPQLRIVSVPDAGLTLAVSHPDHVYRHLADRLASQSIPATRR